MHEHEHLDTDEFRKKLNEHMHGQMACKGAVKAGDVLTHEQMKQLIEDLQYAKHRFICVHGRPTLWSFGKEKLEKHFRRC
jgi:DNA mismatch repair protein MutL